MRINGYRVFEKTLNYLEPLSAFSSGEAIKEARKILEDLQADLKYFEIAQLVNLMPETHEEAKALIPRYVCVCAKRGGD